MATTPTYGAAAGPALIAKTILPADTTAIVDVYDNSAGAAGVQVQSLNICSNDTSAVNIAFYRYSGSTSYLLGTVRVATLSGTDGATSRVNALSIIGVLAPEGINVLEIPAGSKLQASSLVTVTAAKTVTITGWAKTFT